MTEENKNTESQSDWKKREIGALWRRDGKNQKFLSGKITIGEFGEEKEIQIVVFSNRFKEKDNQPDFRVYEDSPMKKKSSDDGSSNPSPSNEEDDLPDILK